MNGIVIFFAIVASAAAFPGYYLHETPVVHTKTTITKNSQLVDHGSTTLVHTPVLHAVPVAHAIPSHKSTITKNSHVVNHGSTHVYHPVAHVPVVHHAPVVHLAPVVHHAAPLTKSTITKTSQVVNHGSVDVYHPVVHTPVVHTPVVHTPLVTLKTGDSAISHSSQSVHETVPLVALHHH